MEKPARYPPKRNKLLFKTVGNRWPSSSIKLGNPFLYGPTVLEALIIFWLIPWAVKLGSQRFTNSLQRKWWPSSKVVIWRVLLLLGGRKKSELTSLRSIVYPVYPYKCSKGCLHHLRWFYVVFLNHHWPPQMASRIYNGRSLYGCKFPRACHQKKTHTSMLPKVRGSRALVGKNMFPPPPEN